MSASYSAFWETVTSLSEKDIESIRRHVLEHRSSVAIIRTEHAPTELDQLLTTIAEACGLSQSKKTWSPTSDFGFAELNSNDRILVVLWVGGPRTELVSVSELEPDSIPDMEVEVFQKNYLSSSIRDGL